jgi:hypothetical protein
MMRASKRAQRWAVGLAIAALLMFVPASAPAVQQGGTEAEQGNGVLIVLLTATGWDQSRFTVPPNTYDYDLENASGATVTFKGRLHQPNGTIKTVFNEAVNAGGELRGTVKL